MSTPPNKPRAPDMPPQAPQHAQNPKTAEHASGSAGPVPACSDMGELPSPAGFHQMRLHAIAEACRVVAIELLQLAEMVVAPVISTGMDLSEPAVAALSMCALDVLRNTGEPATSHRVELHAEQLADALTTTQLYLDGHWPGEPT